MSAEVNKEAEGPKGETRLRSDVKCFDFHGFDGPQGCLAGSEVDLSESLLVLNPFQFQEVLSPDSETSM